jgi:NADPH:quinone reductase-like Zn-dependent oxidoreductase
LRVIELQEAFGFDNLRCVERPAPQAGPAEVVVRVQGASINRRDVGIVSGTARNALAYRPPLVPMSDAAGEVVEIGPGVTRWRCGDRVTARFFPAWLSGDPAPELLGGVMGGGLQGAAQEYLRLPEHAVSASPANLSHVEAATLPCAALTAWRALIVESRLRAGETVLVLGTGGVALFALQFAKASGARVIVTSSSDKRLERARQLGADDTINYSQVPDWGVEARRLTGGRGVDHVVEVGGAGTLGQSIAATRFGGTIALVGRLADAEAGVPVASIFSQNQRIAGVTVGSRAHFEDMVRCIEVCDIHPIIEAVFDLEATAQAFRRVAANGVFGKVAISLSEQGEGTLERLDQLRRRARRARGDGAVKNRALEPRPVHGNSL